MQNVLNSATKNSCSEYNKRMENGINRRLHEAKFPIKKYLVDFDRSKYDAAFLPKFEELETLQFISKKENIILIGTPGAGKTHYAIALGISACLSGKSVLFASVPNLVVELKEAMSNLQISSYRREFEKYNLVILDELGYVSFDKSGCEMLFNLLSSRNDKGLTIITTDLTFDLWEDVFKERMLPYLIQLYFLCAFRKVVKIPSNKGLYRHISGR